MEITSRSDDEIVFEISPLTADEVDSIQDRFYQQIASEIGEFDAGFLWNIMLHGWSEGYWRDFGRSGSRISFRFDEIDGEKWIHSASWDAIEGDWRGGKTGYRFLPERIFPGMQTFLERQSYLIDYLPDDFRLTGEH